MAKNRRLEDVLIQTTSMVGVVGIFVGILCLAVNMRAEGLVMKGYVGLVMCCLTAAAIVGRIRERLSAPSVERTSKVRDWRRTRMVQQSCNGLDLSNVGGNARKLLTAENTHVISHAILRISEPLIVLVPQMLCPIALAERHIYQTYHKPYESLAKTQSQIATRNV